MARLRIVNVYPETISDGYGIRYSIYFAGCIHRCNGCHNPQTWDYNAGVELDESLVENIIAEINKNPLLDGITLTGGDPLLFAQEMLCFIKILKERTGMNIWCYTGYVYEDIIKNAHFRAQCLKYIDVLVDGRFLKEFSDPNLHFRGSSNQRILFLKDAVAYAESQDGLALEYYANKCDQSS